eukprot:TRINITY_DN12097_c0_g1_i1.p1 TRINITY_DN12097_c0_g1~~TRINITY_DN12097_c0_g1_i1.p1  ORF type:complete len:417 (+),score=80.38 TRINITY_DN12097_c0_g1_i1:148-1398(+)
MLLCCENHPDSVFDKYVFGDVLGHGAFGEVRTCQALRGWRRREFAVKVIDRCSSTVKAQEEVLAVKNEADILRDLHHPNIVKFVEFFEDHDDDDGHDGRFLYLITELVKGGELFDAICDVNAMVAERDVARVALMVLSALQYLHSHHIVHRDVKSQNIMLTDRPHEGGRVLEKADVKLIDFGMAANNTSGLKVMCGSAAMRAPEAFAVAADAPARWKDMYGYSYGAGVDLWALGVVLYLMLYGRLPYRAPTGAEVAVRVCSPNFEPPFPVSDGSGPSAASEEVLRGLLKKRPDERMTASEALEMHWLQEASGKRRRRCRGLSLESGAIPRPVLESAVAEARFALQLEMLEGQPSDSTISAIIKEREAAFELRQQRASSEFGQDLRITSEETDSVSDSGSDDSREGSDHISFSKWFC